VQKPAHSEGRTTRRADIRAAQSVAAKARNLLPSPPINPPGGGKTSMGVVDFLLGIGFMGLLAVGLSVTPGANSGAEFWTARIAFVLAALVAGGAYFRWVLEHSRPLYAITVFAVVTAAIALVGLPLALYWVNQKATDVKASAYSGTLLSAGDGLLYSPALKGKIALIQIGQSGLIFGPPGIEGVQPMETNEIGAYLLPGLEETQFKAEVIDRKMKVSALFIDDSGKIIAEISRNEWKLSSQNWDRNYSDNALEVKEPKGHIILQVRLLPDRLQLQGIWPAAKKMWAASHSKWIAIRQDPDRPRDAQVIILGGMSSAENWPEIRPLFVYPSQHNLGVMMR
jgi:hypothetical protein